MVDPNEFFRGIGDDLVALVSNLKETLEESNAIESLVVETDAGQSQIIQENSSKTEN